MTQPIQTGSYGAIGKTDEPMTTETQPVASADDQYPHLRRVGRYLFYAPCAFGLAVLVELALTAIGLKRDFATSAIFPVFFVAFLALRDIEKNAEARGRQAIARTGTQ